MLLRLALVVCLAAIGGWLYSHVQSRHAAQLPSAPTRRWRGAFHVHSTESHDSAVPLRAWVEAARLVDLDFLVITDHDGAERAAERIDGVWVLFAPEQSAATGHVINLGSPVLAHPSDRKHPYAGSLRGIAGLEIANAASMSRRRAGPALLGALPALLLWRVQPRLALAQLYDRDDDALAQWDGEPDPQVVGLCGVDAHGHFDLAHNLAIWNLVLDGPATCGAEVLALLLRGQFHCEAGLLARGALFQFAGFVGDALVALPGDSAAVDRLVVAAPRAQLILLRDGAPIWRAADSIRYDHPPPGLYRVEVEWAVPGLVHGQRRVPVLYSNRIAVLPHVGEPPL
jgi:hypothetical protein